MSDYTFEIGGENEFILLPEADGVRCLFEKIEPSSFNDKALRFGFLIDDPDYDGGDSEEVDEAIRSASEDAFTHYENVNIPQGKIGKRTKLYKLLKGMSGGDFGEGSRVDLDEYVGKHYRVDFAHVDKMTPDGSGGFSVVRDDRGRSIKKAAIDKVRPERKQKAKAKSRKVEAPVEPDVPDDDDDIDLDEIEE